MSNVSVSDASRNHFSENEFTIELKNFFCPETYDLTFKGAIKEQSSVTVPSTFFAFSICVWIKFPAYNKAYFKKEFGVLGYTPIFPDMTIAHLSVKYEKEGVPTLVLRYYHT